MNKSPIKKISTKSGDWTVELDLEAFQQSNGLAISQHTKLEKKYNIRIKQEDINLLDALAEQKSISRSQLINQIIYEILLGDLLDIKDADVRLLLAETADHRARLDKSGQPWAVDAFNSTNQSIFNNVRKYNVTAIDYFDATAPEGHDYNSEHYHEVKRMLEEI